MAQAAHVREREKRAEELLDEYLREADKLTPSAKGKSEELVEEGLRIFKAGAKLRRRANKSFR